MNIVDHKASVYLGFEQIRPRFVCAPPFTKEGSDTFYVKVKQVGTVDISLPASTEINPGDIVLAGMFQGKNRRPVVVVGIIVSSSSCRQRMRPDVLR